MEELRINNQVVEVLSHDETSALVNQITCDAGKLECLAKQSEEAKKNAEKARNAVDKAKEKAKQASKAADRHMSVGLFNKKKCDRRSTKEREEFS